MRELPLAVDPSYDPARPPAGGRKIFSLPRVAFFVSIAAHVVAGYALALQKWAAPAPPRPVADFFLFETPAPRPAEPAPVGLPPEVEEPPPEPAPLPRAVEVVPEPSVAVEPVPVGEPAPVEEAAASAAPEAFIDFDEERRRAANEVVEERAARQYMTFSLDDVVPPRPAAEPPPPPSIFDGGSGPDFGGRSVATVGQQRTKFGRKLAEFCNALTGGFGAVFQGFGLFSACASPETGLSGFLPEVRPAYLDLMPECVDTRDTAPALALEAPFPTIKCRLVERVDPEEQP